jgi:putative hydrolase of the HAD superfamily
MKKPMKIVLFDLGNVLAHIDFDAFWRSLGFKEIEVRHPYTVGYKDLTRNYETGLISTEKYLEKLSSLFEQQFSISRLQQAVESIIEEPIEGILELVKKVSSKYQTALVSNTNELHYILCQSRFEAFQLFHKHYLSYQLHVMKPAPGFYRAIIEDLQVEPYKMLFVDDLQINVDGAIAAGMQAVRFKGVENLVKTLSRFS